MERPFIVPGSFGMPLASVSAILHLFNCSGAKEAGASKNLLFVAVVIEMGFLVTQADPVLVVYLKMTLNF